MDACQVEGCSRKVTKAGHQFCLDHWKAERAGTVTQCTSCGRWHEGTDESCAACAKAPAADDGDEEAADEQSTRSLLSSTKIGKHFGLSNIKTNLVLAELGWIEKYVKGWVPTDRGTRLGANVKDGRKAPYVVWPASILSHPVLIRSVEELTGKVGWVSDPPSASSSASPNGGSRPTLPPARGEPDNFREKFPAKFVTIDGHRVRSRAELIIDNWLYMQEIVHAYERRLPIEEDCYCDFYLPGGKGVGGKGVYIEFWGRESDPKYRERKATKQAIYAEGGLRVIELGDAEIERLNDVLPRCCRGLGSRTIGFGRSGSGRARSQRRFASSNGPRLAFSAHVTGYVRGETRRSSRTNKQGG